MSLSFESMINQALNEYKKKNLYRKIYDNDLSKSNIINFCDNDYLGLRNNQKIFNLIKSNISSYPTGSGASHLISGHHSIHSKLENLLSDYLGFERTILCSTGYMANLAIITALNKISNKNLFLYHDKLNHASLFDATLLNKVKFTRFKHNDFEHLEYLIKKNQEDLKDSHLSFIVTEGIFSMDGDRANLEKLSYLKNKYGVYIILDNAHDFLVNDKNINEINKVADIYMATLGKAAGGFGAFISAKSNFIESIIQFSRSYIYTTALSPLMVYTNFILVKEAIENNTLRDKLKYNIKYFVNKSVESKINIINKNIDSPSHIQPIILKDSSKALDIAEKLKEKGIHITAIRYPTVPKNLDRLRITLSARHETNEIDKLIENLRVVLNEN